MASSPPARAAWLQRAWQHRSGLARWLLPLSWLYGALIRIRRWLYSAGWFKTHRLPVAVIVVGNVVVGGAGKTPVSIAVIAHLQRNGWTPGLVSRGYGRRSTGLQVSPADDLFEPDAPALDAAWSSEQQRNPCQALDPSIFGDEPALVAQRCGIPVAVAGTRSDAARGLLAQHSQVDVLVCDDGLQHLALARDVDICVWSAGGAGNGWLLPAGPLREPWPRAVDLLLYAGEAAPPGSSTAFALRRRLASHARTAHGESVALASLAQQAQRPGKAESPGGAALVAVAGTARPEEFFAMLRATGIVLEDAIALPDHYDFNSFEFNTDKRYRLICTEKDAVKLWRHFPDALAVRLDVDLPPAFFSALDSRLAALPYPRPVN